MNTHTNPAMNFEATGVLEQAVHLSEDQIDDQLLGDLSGGAAEHLAVCEHCSARVAAAEEPMVDFRDVAMAWSERRSATMPLPVTSGDGLLWQRRMGWVTAAFALALGISVIGNGHRAGVETASVEPDQTMQTAGAAPARIAVAPRAVLVEAGRSTPANHYSGDNQMLQAIDTELDAAVETPATLGLEPAGEQTRDEGGLTSLEN